MSAWMQSHASLTSFFSATPSKSGTQSIKPSIAQRSHSHTPSSAWGVVCVGAVSCAALMGTPFILALAAPIGLDVFFRYGPVRTVFWGVGFTVLWLVSLDDFSFAVFSDRLCSRIDLFVI
jgi:hypothetical protein